MLSLLKIRNFSNSLMILKLRKKMLKLKILDIKFLMNNKNNVLLFFIYNLYLIAIFFIYACYYRKSFSKKKINN